MSDYQQKRASTYFNIKGKRKKKFKIQNRGHPKTDSF